MAEHPKTVPEATPTHQTANVASSEAYETANAVSDTEPEASPTFGPPMVAGEVGTLGPYRVLRELGRGGMGAVYLGFDERLKRHVALKVMLPKYASMDSSKNRFLREARAAAGIAHDHIVTIYEAGEHDGTPYLTMQLLQGYPLDSYLKKQAPDLAETLRIGRELALGLSAAHGVGLIHRDIKPGNIWLEAPNGRVKILDFGLAKPTDEQRHDHELTASGVVLGTPSYMPPEQARGDKTDHRADLFSLGVVLYRLAAGRLPFPGTTMMAIFASVMTDEPIPVREWNPAVPEPLAWLIHELLAKKPKDRPASAAEVAERLKQIQLGAAAAISTPMQVIPLDSYSTLSRLPRGADAFADLDATESEAIVTRTNPPAAKKGPTSKWPLLALGLLLVACFALVPQLISIMTPKGTLVIESSDPDVEITVKKDGAVLVDKSKGREFTLKVADNYLIEMVEKEGLKLSTDKFEITKGGKATVKVRVEKPKEKPPKPKEASATGAGNVSVADRKAAEWVLSVGGEVRVDGFLTDIKSLVDLPKDGYKLTFFSLADNALATDRSLGIFRDCTNLKGLKLDNTSITEAGLAHFKDHPNFEFLFLNGLPNLGGGLIHIKDFQSLGGLYLVGTPVTDESLVHLEGLNGLRALVLFKTKVTEAGLKRLAAKVPQCTIEWDGGRILATVTDRLAADWLQTRGGHIGISVPEGHREIRADAGEKVPDVPLELTSFKLAGDQFTSDADLAKFRTLSKLDTIVLSQTAVGDVGLEHLATLPVLEKLYLVGTKVTDAGLKSLGRCKQLQTLHIKNTAVTEGGVKAFAARLPGCRIEWDRGVFVPRDPNREAANYAISVGGKVQVNERLNEYSTGVALPVNPFRVTHANLGNCSQVTDAGLAAFAGCEHLLFLDLGQTETGDVGASHFKLCKKLTVLSLAHTKVGTAGLGHFKDCKQLQQLNLTDVPLTAETLALFKDCTDLTRLDLRNSGVDDAALVHLVGLARLANLNLKMTKATRAGIEKLHAEIPQCRILWDGDTIEPKPVPNTGLIFDGRVTAVKIPTLNFDGKVPLTVEAWITADAVEGKSRHIFLFGEPGGGLGIGGKGNIGVGFQTGQKWIDEYGDAVPVGRRVHVAAVVTEKAYYLYLDGKGVGYLEGKFDALPPTRPPALIGKHTKEAPEGHFSGTIHSLRVSKSARYLTGFLPTVRLVKDAGTVALYRFDEGAGTKLNDHSGNGHDGVVENGTWVK